MCCYMLLPAQDRHILAEGQMRAGLEVEKARHCKALSLIRRALEGGLNEII